MDHEHGLRSGLSEYHGLQRVSVPCEESERRICKLSLSQTRSTRSEDVTMQPV